MLSIFYPSNTARYNIFESFRIIYELIKRKNKALLRISVKDSVVFDHPLDHIRNSFTVHHNGLKLLYESVLSNQFDLKIDIELLVNVSFSLFPFFNVVSRERPHSYRAFLSFSTSNAKYQREKNKSR